MGIFSTVPVFDGVGLNARTVTEVCVFSAPRTMMGDLQSCRAAAGGFARLPGGMEWPIGTCRQLLSLTPACRDL